MTLPASRSSSPPLSSPPDITDTHTHTYTHTHTHTHTPAFHSSLFSSPPNSCTPILPCPHPTHKTVSEHGTPTNLEFGVFGYKCCNARPSLLHLRPRPRGLFANTTRPRQGLCTGTAGVRLLEILRLGGLLLYLESERAALDL